MTSTRSLDQHLGDFTADMRVVTLTVMAAVIGVVSALVALALVRLIGLVTNLAYFHRFAGASPPLLGVRRASGRCPSRSSAD